MVVGDLAPAVASGAAGAVGAAVARRALRSCVGFALDFRAFLQWRSADRQVEGDQTSESDTDGDR